VQWSLPVATRALRLAATTELKGNNVSFTAKVLAAVDDVELQTFERKWKDCLHG
jgi:hypothetical protein